MSNRNNRILREKKTVQAMVRIYCRAHHGSKHTQCQECNALVSYALKRLDSCRFAENKPTCLKCPAHCYDKPMRGQMRAIMRYSGPRMLTRHPILAITHMADGRRRIPETAEKG